MILLFVTFELSSKHSTGGELERSCLLKISHGSAKKTTRESHPPVNLIFGSIHNRMNQGFSTKDRVDSKFGFVTKFVTVFGFLGSTKTAQQRLQPNNLFQSWTQKSANKKQQKGWCLAILCDLFGMVKWPFKGLSDLQLGDQKVTAWITWVVYFLSHYGSFLAHPCIDVQFQGSTGPFVCLSIPANGRLYNR